MGCARSCNPSKNISLRKRTGDPCGTTCNAVWGTEKDSASCDSLRNHLEQCLIPARRTGLFGENSSGGSSQFGESTNQHWDSYDFEERSIVCRISQSYRFHRPVSAFEELLQRDHGSCFIAFVSDVKEAPAFGPAQA